MNRSMEISDMLNAPGMAYQEVSGCGFILLPNKCAELEKTLRNVPKNFVVPLAVSVLQKFDLNFILKNLVGMFFIHNLSFPATLSSVPASVPLFQLQIADTCIWNLSALTIEKVSCPLTKNES